ncbi:MAG: class I SAM-dependent methyltransferase [Patescibacteria group bacterium]|nr:class I SAM-dependent methyltransferase [Patescibacteria group bacterium]MDD5121019.1 class I SAM-dependent methyltransferase [Patescibacteria group bacterium]MDD5221620.1 class I SAM-dependent methyltransferase [Patescibacteria group bacterium]MDD5396062.1 class I SAM-dependent methyltransferase [Patescibacteria group bacterium]
MKKTNSISWHTSVAERWKIYDSPARPSKGECQIIQEFINSHKKNPKILILGSTPEFRDLAHNLRAEITCVDASLEMLIGMSELMKHKNLVNQEIWFRSNWLTMPVTENYYDFVLGDLVVTNLPLQLQPVFLKKIKSILKPGGYFITRDWWPPIVKSSLESAIDRLSKRGINKKSINILTWDLLNLSYNYQKKIATTDEMYRLVKDLRQKGKDQKKKKWLSTLMKHVVYNYPLGKTWFVKMRPEAEKTFSKYFQIKSVQCTKDHCRADQCPIYFLKKS